MIVGFVDIDGIVNHHCFILSFHNFSFSLCILTFEILNWNLCLLSILKSLPRYYNYLHRHRQPQCLEHASNCSGKATYHNKYVKIIIDVPQINFLYLLNISHHRNICLQNLYTFSCTQTCFNDHLYYM